MTRRKYSIDFKKQVVKEAKETGNLAAVARRYNYLLTWWGTGSESWKAENMETSTSLRFLS
ncbi:transposase [Aneurinibacillus sp. XH2]|uniref:transposase n=1 Tax=Aneurinibacillus sp. XH2 TaxID=1450761 RepID=UPI000A5BBC25|nr:transposase [Aneurinibacillus sp. XH2]